MLLAASLAEEGNLSDLVLGGEEKKKKKKKQRVSKKRWQKQKIRESTKERAYVVAKTTIVVI